MRPCPKRGSSSRASGDTSGFYCDKRNWIACLLDGGLPDSILRELCGDSYQLIFRRLPKYVQKEILEE